MCRTYQWFLVLSGLLGNTDTLFSHFKKHHTKEGDGGWEEGWGTGEVHLEPGAWAPGKCSIFLSSGIRQRRWCSIEVEKKLAYIGQKNGLARDGFNMRRTELKEMQ